MTLGEHLEELRGCVLRSLAALVLACLVMIWPAKYLLEVIARPVVLALRRHGQPDSFLATGPVESILVYIKVVVIFGLIAASPYILYQLWNFVAVGVPHCAGQCGAVSGRRGVHVCIRPVGESELSGRFQRVVAVAPAAAQPLGASGVADTGAAAA